MKEEHVNKGKYRPLLVVLLFLFFVPGVHAVQDQTGWPIYVGDRAVISSPTLADLDGDGDFEVLVGSQDGNVYAWHGDGANVTGWPISTSYSILSSPAVGDLDRDGDLEIVAVSTQIGVNVPKFSIYAWHHDGTLIWSSTIGAGVTSSPALGDLDGDGDLEIIVGAEDNSVYAWHHDGSVVAGWPKATGGRVWSSPALADLDGDNLLEVVVGSEGGSIYAWHHDGSLYWSRAIGKVHDSSPAIADLDGDGQLEVVIGSTGGLYALNHDGTLLWSKNIKYVSSPAIADIDGDGDLEVVVGTSALAPNNKLYVFSDDGTVVWTRQLRRGRLKEYREKVVSSPVIGDTDGDGRVEIVVATTVNTADLNAGMLYAWNSDGTLAWYQPISGATSYFIASSPALADIDGDGDVEVVVGSRDGNVYAWDLDGAYDPENVKWAMFRHNAMHTGTRVLNNKLDIILAQTDKTHYLEKENVIISCVVQDHYGIRISAGSVEAVVEKPDGSTDTIVLLENNFGNYSAAFTDTLQTGDYTVTIYADRGGYKNATAGLTFGVFSPPFWNYRIPIDVDTGASEMVDVPIEVEINFTQKLEELDTNGTFDENSIRVFEADAARNDLQEIFSQFEKKIGGGIGTTNIAQGKTATASSEYGSTYSASKAVDGSGSTFWVGTGDHYDWLKVDLGESAYISKVVVSGYDSSYYPRDFTIQVSLDDATYTTVEEVTGNGLATTTHLFSTPIYAHFVKLVVTENNGYPWTYLREFEIYPGIGGGYDASTNAIGDITWIMDGTTQANASRYYHVYFDILENGPKLPPDYGIDYGALVMPGDIAVTKGPTEIVRPTNDLPTASIVSPTNGSVHTMGFMDGATYHKLGNSIAFNGSGTDSDGTIVAYHWTSSIDGVLSNSSSFDASDLSIGTHVITLTVADDEGATDTAQVAIRINDPPTASMISPISGLVYSQRDTTTFNGSGTDSDGTIASYQWDSSLEGAIGTEGSFTSSSLYVGIHTITLIVTDNDGGYGTARVTINQTEYVLEWLLNKATFEPGSTIPIKFTVKSPTTGEFVVDETAVVRVYDPDMNEVFNASYAEESELKEIFVRINEDEDKYMTNFHSSRDAIIGSYTIRAEFASDRPNKS